MLRALRTASLGMTTQQAGVDNIANNLANANTTGYKRSTIVFQDLLYQNVQAAGQGEAGGGAQPSSLQMGHGAVGLSCATLGEAEVMAGAGLRGVLITSPIVTAPAIDRLMTVHRQADGLLVVADNPNCVRQLGAAARAAGKVLGVLVDYDVGQRRTGVASDAAAVELASQVSTTEGLQYKGVQAYYGHLQHVPAYADRKGQAMAQMARIRSLCGRLVGNGLAPEIVAGGGTGTFDIDHRGEVFTETQPGSYIFMDVEYGAVEIVEGGDSPFRPALFVRATVVSTNHEARATTNAGMKALAPDGPPPRLTDGARPSASYSFGGDEHGIVDYGPSDDPLAVGDSVECIVPHCDTTTNLFNVFHCVRGHKLVDIWPIEARGRW